MNKPLLLSWLTAIIAVIGSLYFSEVMHYVPCTFCWYQRILMYPLAVFLGVAFYHQDSRIARYVLPLSVLGIFVSGYHIALQKIPALQEFEVCTSGVPCSQDYINWLGFITIPMLAFTAFVIITVSMIILSRKG
ncbi:disulfide oxidoreductase [Fictibacillus sp. WQ 8-8]|uniref:disulfide oxidoreductase n=1 Tax=unclassified Fictibacillus TaxID=2644029 RepID=UPI000785026D|nr:MULTISPECIES: disulfide oxidoreductase [unclassified Fictibacillus]MCQ6264904.1 disulfide oxidoreductase [Fictibacillus sp. WQ 8-8]MED2970877.1 disulfide oxidoreductase [Fictibacillus sp. B-59209]